MTLAGVTVFAQAPERRRRRRSVPPTVKLPQIQKHQLTNGVPVWIVELHECRSCRSTWWCCAGGRRSSRQVRRREPDDGDADRGRRLARGARNRRRDRFSRCRSRRASGIDSSAIRLHVPVAVWAMRCRSWPTSRCARRFRRTSSNGCDSSASPACFRHATIRRRLPRWPSHACCTALAPVRHRDDGHRRHDRGIHVDDLRAFYAATFRPDNATLLIVGDVTPDKVLPIVEANSAAGKRPAGGAHPPSPGPARTRREIYLVDKPGAPQSQIRIGSIGVPRSTPDYFAIQVMNTISVDRSARG